MLGQGDLKGLREPYEICLTPLWFRLFAAGSGIVAAVAASFALVFGAWTQIGAGLPSAMFPIVLGSGLAVFLCIRVLRFFDPLDQGKWFHFALTRDGIYLAARRSRLVFVPWSAVLSVDVERRYGRHEYSAARLTLDLDEEIWRWFGRGARVDGEGTVRRMSVHVPDVRGDEIVSRIEAYRVAGPNDVCHLP